jgi:hypothetical protein
MARPITMFEGRVLYTPKHLKRWDCPICGRPQSEVYRNRMCEEDERDFFRVFGYVKVYDK